MPDIVTITIQDLTPSVRTVTVSDSGPDITSATIVNGGPTGPTGPQGDPGLDGAHYVPSLVPVQTSIANATEAADAAANATAINARLTAWADQDTWTPLDLKAHGYIIDSSLVIPRRTGGSIRCDGGFTGTTRAESEYETPSSIGGMGTRILRHTSMDTSDPMIDYSGGGLEIQGCLMLQGLYSDDRDDLTITPDGSNKTGVGILVRGVGGTGGISTGMNTGKIHANSLTFSNLETGIQLGTYIDQNAADNLRIQELQFDFCQRGFYFANQQCVALHFGHIRPYSTPIVFDMDGGADMTIDSVDMGTDVDTTFLRFNASNNWTRNNGKVHLGYIYVDGNADNCRVVECASGIGGAGIQVSVDHLFFGPLVGTAPWTHSRSLFLLRNRASVRINLAYGLHGSAFEMYGDSTGYTWATLGAGSQVLPGVAPEDLIHPDSRYCKLFHGEIVEYHSTPAVQVIHPAGIVTCDGSGTITTQTYDLT